MAVTYVDSTQSMTQGASSGSVNVPSGVADGDIILLFAHSYDSTSRSWSWPAGFTELAAEVNGWYHVYGVAWKRASGESGSYSVSLSGGGSGLPYSLMCVAYRGADSGESPFSFVSDTAYVTNNTTVRAAGGTAAAGDMLAWWGATSATASGLAPPGGSWTSRESIDDAGNAHYSDLADLSSEGGATGNIDGTCTGSTPYKHAFMVAVKAAPSTPTITGLSIPVGSTAGGTSVVITGKNFTGATAVKFGLTDAASYTVDSATQITATSPAHAAGSVQVSVTTASGTSADTSSDDFLFVDLAGLGVLLAVGQGIA